VTALSLSERQPPRDIAEKPKAYAFERSLGIPPAEVCRRAGGNVENGQATKWENNKRVQAWIAHYRTLGQTEEMLTAKRQRLEDELQMVGTANMDDFITLVPSGSYVVPMLDLTRLQAMSEAERRATMAAVKTVRYTENGPTFEMHGKLEAIAQLRDMHGFKAPAKTELSGLNGAPILHKIERVIVDSKLGLEVHGQNFFVSDLHPHTDTVH
jgi:hypothetical protein